MVLALYNSFILYLVECLDHRTPTLVRSGGNRTRAKREPVIVMCSNAGNIRTATNNVAMRRYHFLENAIFKLFMKTHQAVHIDE